MKKLLTTTNILALAIGIIFGWIVNPGAIIQEVVFSTSQNRPVANNTTGIMCHCTKYNGTNRRWEGIPGSTGCYSEGEAFQNYTYGGKTYTLKKPADSCCLTTPKLAGKVYVPSTTNGNIKCS
ncbi:hypothetical protein CRENPOLYSF2_4140003 [Crenothrix polyspora]|uniref:Uncharacterized protein n=1 Tax=Crenothrix polyspora TaxID=360316 RepID=A0A1R4HF14_9GAMM|nr:hypothetical protein [Crenothrix polyspora]SJM94621.1 hypothetical protein CRENPOLYSF2_4140003 [Crenothrix polyspora]